MRGGQGTGTYVKPQANTRPACDDLFEALAGDRERLRLWGVIVMKEAALEQVEEAMPAISDERSVGELGRLEGMRGDEGGEVAVVAHGD